MRRTDKNRRSARAGSWQSGRAPRAYSRGSWYELLRPYLEPSGDARQQSESEFPIDETEAILFSLALAVEQRDRQTAGHCERLALMSVALGVAMGLARSSLMALYRGGYLHDVGKVGIPDSILFKPGSLTAEEWVTMRSHTVRGEEICRHMKSLAPVMPIIRHHHERWDGTGYPDGLRGEQIPLLARVLQVVDIYDALTSARPYKPACTAQQAIQVLKEETDRGWRDPHIVNLFLKLHREVLCRIAEYATAAAEDHHLESMRESLANLEAYLKADFEAENEVSRPFLTGLRLPA
jgi:response regulator RpfG family c-di-GMP phosphodiesterase